MWKESLHGSPIEANIRPTVFQVGTTYGSHYITLPVYPFFGLVDILYINEKVFKCPLYQHALIVEGASQGITINNLNNKIIDHSSELFLF